MNRIAGPSPRQLARIAGGLYLLNIVGDAFAIGFVPAVVVVAGDAAATAHSIQANEQLYGLSVQRWKERAQRSGDTLSPRWVIHRTLLPLHDRGIDPVGEGLVTPSPSPL